MLYVVFYLKILHLLFIVLLESLSNPTATHGKSPSFYYVSETNCYNENLPPNRNTPSVH